MRRRQPGTTIRSRTRKRLALGLLSHFAGNALERRKTPRHAISVNYLRNGMTETAGFGPELPIQVTPEVTPENPQKSGVSDLEGTPAVRAFAPSVDK
jgi:hypothetical protein